MKNLYFALLACFIISGSFAQTSVGIQGASTHSHTDATPSKVRTAFGINAQHHFTSYISLRGNLNFGQLRGGEISESNLMSYTNNFVQADLGFRFYPFAFMNIKPSSGLYYVSKVYGGSGFGVMKSNSTINDQLTKESFRFMSDYKGTDIVIPVEFGLELPLGKISSNPKFNLNLYYRFNFMTTDKMDGYDPNLASNKSNDAFSSFGVGVNCSFGAKKAKQPEVEEAPKFED